MAVVCRGGIPKLLRLTVAAVFALTLLLYSAVLTNNTSTVSSGDAEHVASRVLQEALSAELLPMAAELPVEQAAPENPSPVKEEIKDGPPIDQGGMDVIFSFVPDPVKEEKTKSDKKIVSIKKVEVTKTVEKKVSVISVSAKTGPREYENPPVVTSTIYASGHSISSKVCGETKGSDLRMLVLVTTAPGNGAERSAVRGTWGHVALRKDVAFAFFVGQSKNASENKLVKEESFLYDDVIQGNFVDSYNNLTLKTISMLEWVSNHCSRVRFMLKTDDDMFINFPPLLKLVSAVKRPRLIFGKLAQKWKPIRNTSSKYYVPLSLFSDEYYPDFTTGPAYILTGDIIKDLYTESLKGIFYKLEDVYVTGLIAKKLKIDHMNFEQFINRRVTLDTCKVKTAISIHMVKTFEMYDLWKRLSDGLEKCDKPVPKSAVKTTTKRKSTVKVNRAH